ncbi:WhiB family transcriptional regulator [Streptomyces sp. NPDC006544]|uniref:WhiB family transcriptional regulator n=1 Tax=Streptomyces sp. NPDC006544 TaxID=3154583 RepID=UPI0033A324BA
MTTQPWEDLAVCRNVGIEIFHPQGRGAELAAAEEAAKGICIRLCPVREECLRLALEREGHADRYNRGGIWGGLTPQERAALRTAA